jgi:hypothetical protein
MNFLTLKISHYQNDFFKRSRYLFCYNDKIINSEYLYRFGYSATKETVAILQGMIDGTLAWKEHEWVADDLFYVVSGKELSRIENHEIWDDANDCWTVIGNYPTKELLDLLNAWKDFQEKYSIPENYITIAKKAFEIIRKEPSQYDKYKNGTNIDFEVMINNINIIIIAENMSEFELSSDEYVEQIK